MSMDDRIDEQWEKDARAAPPMMTALEKRDQEQAEQKKKEKRVEQAHGFTAGVFLSLVLLTIVGLLALIWTGDDTWGKITATAGILAGITHLIGNELFG